MTKDDTIMKSTDMKIFEGLANWLSNYRKQNHKLNRKTRKFQGDFNKRDRKSDIDAVIEYTTAYFRKLPVAQIKMFRDLYKLISFLSMFTRCPLINVFIEFLKVYATTHETGKRFEIEFYEEPYMMLYSLLFILICYPPITYPRTFFTIEF